ncbi:CRISPR-associated Cas1 family protein 1 [Thermococcus cleftensis]|uniref:CRISPR-associated endonuclease Cas1 n=1 Tax=Thermococcus cleftensis (strain DSM 27260 / KACC 17922 / CL1) TaxID=163003 RepID=I3ZWC6_THECF|nr:type I-B CRISPR-associated endonuclease Cas1b [Thermococcus cleftensis]AFL96010.1 CRISPR-associated Cas1 family protein 1 [Thermococcus cleftensis]
MKRPVYITQMGVLERRGNTLFLENENGKRAIPINSTSEIHCFKPVSLTSGAIKLLSEKNVPVHFYNKYGYYRGSYMPVEGQVSGTVVVKQAEHYLDTEKRLYIARQFLEGIKASMIALLSSRRAERSTIEGTEVEGDSPAELMGVESRLWKEFYSTYATLLKHFEFDERNRRPPRDEVNALISLGNSVLYTVALSEIRKTYLHPAISYLHEPLERRYSLALDLADIFKPITVFRVILRLVNRRQIREEHFSRDVGVMLNREGLKVFLGELNSELDRKVLHPRFKRKVSVRYMVRLEGYSLVKHLLGDRRYQSLRAWW